MFESLSTRIQDVFKSLRGEARFKDDHHIIVRLNKGGEASRYVATARR